MMLQSRRPLTIGGLLILLLLALLIAKQLVNLKELRTTLVTEQAALMEGKAKLQALVNLEQRSVNIQSEIERLSEVFPSQPNEHKLIEELQEKVSRRGLHMSNLTFGNYQDKQEYLEMPFQMTLEGEYISLLGLLKDLPNGSRAILIKSIKLNKSQPELPLITIDISASTFYSKQ